MKEKRIRGMWLLSLVMWSARQPLLNQWGVPSPLYLKPWPLFRRNTLDCFIWTSAILSFRLFAMQERLSISSANYLIYVPVITLLWALLATGIALFIKKINNLPFISPGPVAGYLKNHSIESRDKTSHPDDHEEQR